METTSMQPIAYRAQGRPRVAAPWLGSAAFLGANESLKSKARHFLRLFALAFDAVALFGAEATAWWLLFHHFAPPFATEALRLSGFVLLPVLFGALYVARIWTRWEIVYETAKSLSLAAVVLACTLAFLPVGGWHFAYLTLGLSGAAFVAWRLLFFRLISKGAVTRLALSTDITPDLAPLLESDAIGERGFEIIGVVGSETTVADLNYLGSWGELQSLARSHRLDAVIVAPQDVAERAPQSAGVSLVPFATAYERLGSRVPIDHIDEAWFSQGSLEHHGRRYGYLLAKRLIDVTAASVGLVLTSAVFPFVALAIKLSSRGPILYSQTRVGHHGKLFKIYKFRTMRLDAEKTGAVWASENDPRVTLIGRFLRRSRLDELPQFWNVLNGEMSIVGPRPERPEFVTMLEANIPYYGRRHDVIPGITGWAQVMFQYGASVEDTKEKLQYDLYYIKNRSFYLDLKIMVQTVSVMFSKFGGR